MKGGGSQRVEEALLLVRRLDCVKHSSISELWPVIDLLPEESQSGKSAGVIDNNRPT
jgi:hypothetical protein